MLDVVSDDSDIIGNSAFINILRDEFTVIVADVSFADLSADRSL